MLPGRLYIPKSQSIVEDGRALTTDFPSIDSNRQILVSFIQSMHRKVMSLNSIARSIHLN